MTLFEIMKKANEILISDANRMDSQVRFGRILLESGWIQKTTNSSETRSDLQEIAKGLKSASEDIDQANDNIATALRDIDSYRDDVIEVIKSIEE